jgi:hypothetical protein
VTQICLQGADRNLRFYRKRDEGESWTCIAGRAGDLDQLVAWLIFILVLILQGFLANLLTLSSLEGSNLVPRSDAPAWSAAHFPG